MAVVVTRLARWYWQVFVAHDLCLCKIGAYRLCGRIEDRAMRCWWRS